MRIVIAALAATLVAGLAFTTADAAPAQARKQIAKGKQSPPAQRPAAPRSDDVGYDSTPDHWKFGSSEWWNAMVRDGRGGCCGATN